MTPVICHRSKWVNKGMCFPWFQSAAGQACDAEGIAFPLKGCLGPTLNVHLECMLLGHLEEG